MFIIIPSIGTPIGGIVIYQTVSKGKARPLEADSLYLAKEKLDDLFINETVLDEFSHELIGSKKVLLYQLLVSIGEAATPILTYSIQSPNQKVRERAYQIIGGIGEPLVNLLIKAVDDDDRTIRANVARSLGNLDPDMVRNTLRTLAGDIDANVRLQTFEALSSFDQPDCETLIVGAKDDNNAIRRKAILGLGKCSEAGLPTIENALKDSDRGVRIQALSSLAKIGTPEVIPIIKRKIYAGDHPTVIRTAITSLGLLGEAALESLIELTNNDDEGIKIFAVNALGSVGKSAIPSLQFALDDDSVEVRKMAVNSLSNFGPSSLTVLTDAMADDDPHVRIAIINAFRKIGLPALENLSSVLENEEDVKIRGMVVNIFGGLGEKAIPQLAVVLKDKNPKIREQAMNRLSELGIKSLPVLPIALNSEYIKIRRMAMHTLEGIGLEAIDVLSGALNNPFKDVQKSSVLILARIGEPAIGPLTHALKTDDPDIVMDAIFGLQDIGSPAYGPLLTVAEHENQDVGVEAISAICSIGIDASITTQVAKLLESHHGNVISCVVKNLNRSVFNDAKNAMVRAIFDELIVRSSGLPREQFNSEVTARSLQNLIVSSPNLRTQILERLAKLAFDSGEDICERTINVARIVFPHEFTQYVKSQDEENPDAAARIMRLFGGSEAAYYLSEQQSNTLEQFREPLVNLEEISRNQWEVLSRQTKLAFYLSMSMTGLLFIFGVVLVAMGVYLLFAAEDTVLKVGGAITSGLVSLGTLLSNRFWKDPVDHIRKYSAQQARLEAAFIGYMNRVSQIRFVFENESGESGVALDSLEKYQRLLSEASAQVSQELSAIEGGE